MKGFDINQQADAGNIEDEGTFVHLEGLDEKLLFFTDSDGQEKPVGILVAGVHSRRYREIEGIQRKRRITKKDLTAARAVEDSIEKTAWCSLDWQGFVDGDKPVPFSRENVAAIYRTCPWVLEQVSEAMQEHKRFLQK